MTAAFWWYLLAGFIIGFCLSTVWEWLYFRQRRMRIADRRIAALQQQLDSQMRAASTEIPSEPGVTWTATEYQSPGILLENETDAQPAPRAAVPITAAVLRADQANGRGALAIDPAPPWARAAATQSADAAPSAAEAVVAATLLTHAGTADEPTAEQRASQPPDGDEHHAAEAVVAATLLTHAGTADEPTAEQRASQPPDAERRGAEAAAAAALVAHAGTADEPTAEQRASQPPDAEHHAAKAATAAALVANAGAADEPTAEQRASPPDAEHHAANAATAAALVTHAGTADELTAAQRAAQPPDAEHRGAEAAAAAALVAHAGTADEPTAEQSATQPPDAERRGAEVAAAAALVAHAGAADEPSGEQTEAAPAPTSVPPPPAESAPSNAMPAAVITEVRGFSARQGYIVSELSPGEFTALKATQKARQAARRAWEQARAVTDYLRNV
jgi:hypothetical protein